MNDSLTAKEPLGESDEITRSVEGAMRKLIVIARVVGWVWMLMLVIATLQVDDGADPVIVVAAMVLATLWTAVTIWAARRRSRMGAPWFVLTDLIVVLLVGGASWAAGAADLFHGGYLVPSLIVAAYGTNLYGVAAIATLIGVEQAAILLSWGKGPVPALSSLGFILWGLVFGWLFATIRKTDAYRRATVEDLTHEREESARRMERLELANRLHDSALQTLQVIDAGADDPDRVRSLARRQSRELRSLVEGYVAEETTCSNMLHAVVDEIESLFPVTVSTVVRVDEPAGERTQALCEATKEAMINAAKHAGVSQINLYAAREGDEVRVYVRDEGKGFDPSTATAGHGIENSIRARVERYGGTVSIVSGEGRGTEVILAMPLQRATV